MRYWDSSAIIPLLIAESTSARLREIHSADPAIATWWGTPVECVSAFARLERDGTLTPSGLGRAIARTRNAVGFWTEVGPSDDVREQAIRLLRVHQLRAADAVQLAAAIVAAEFQPGSLDFVTLDKHQGSAADKEGFRVIS
ncbi:MAG: type II toxin-antitoxin system VapC family toxin [Gemmatimonadota bacterium]|nr:type II toxin-antitoxin system VapC family toxin [Gemmatimonadota bacterium]